MRCLSGSFKSSIRIRPYSKAKSTELTSTGDKPGSNDSGVGKPPQMSGSDLIHKFSRDSGDPNAKNWREMFLGKADPVKSDEKASKPRPKAQAKTRKRPRKPRVSANQKEHGVAGVEKDPGSGPSTAQPPKEPGSRPPTDPEYMPPRDRPRQTFLHRLISSDVEYSQFKVPDQPPVAPLANNLDRVLFSPGVHFLKDPRSNVYNFPPELENIMSIRDFDFTKVPQFVPSGKDNRLSRLAEQNGKKYTGSTSSITGILFQLHRALSHQRPPSLMGLSKYFGGRVTSFTQAQRMPTPFLLKYSPETKTHAIAPLPSLKGSDSILSLLGHAMEAMLVTDTAEFANYSRDKSHLLEDQEYHSTYNYLSSGSFMLRSQLDCHDERLPGTGFFDLKTRACCAVRHDIDYAQIRDGCTYQIIKRDGYEESYAREFYELIRTALFKYSLQARIGSMDGIFVAYHNINTLFGFEYLPLEDIDAIFHTAHLVMGEDKRQLPTNLHEKVLSTGSLIAEKEFALSLGVLEKILDRIIATKPESSFKVFAESVGTRGLRLVYQECPDPEQEEADLEIGDEAIKLGQESEDRVDCSNESSAEAPQPPQDKRVMPQTYGYRVLLTNTINGVPVSQDSFPHIETESDCWEVTCEMEQMSLREANQAYKVMKDLYKPQIFQTAPKTSRDEEGTEQDEETAIKQLQVPTAFQERLRELQERGRLYRERNEKREKLTWTPRV